MPKLLLVIFCFSLFACAPDKKLSGTYRSKDIVRGAFTQLIEFKSDSTLSYVAVAYHRDYKFLCTYERINNVLYVIFDYSQISTLRKEQRDSISTIDTYPLLGYDKTRGQIALYIRHHRLFNKITIEFGKERSTRTIKFVKVN